LRKSGPDGDPDIVKPCEKFSPGSRTIALVNRIWLNDSLPEELKMSDVKNCKGAAGVLMGALALAMICGAASAAARADIQLEDVNRFFRVYDASGGHPSADQLQHDYLDPGSEALHRFAQLRNVTGTRIAEALANHPEIYTGARRCLAVLPAVKQRLAAALSKLAMLYPESRFPPVTLLIGRGRPVGITDGSGVSIGLKPCARQISWIRTSRIDSFTTSPTNMATSNSLSLCSC
jgi:hypothetical protein